MIRVSYVIDGFNLYHSLKDAQRDLGGRSTRWLDLQSLCKSYLYLYGRQAVLRDVEYVSALARHLEAHKPDVTARHRRYVECLEATGVDISLNRFKEKMIRCGSCGKMNKRYEEKETDVAIAVSVLSKLARDVCDIVVILSGDTDLAPVVREANVLYPSKQVAFAFPYRRKNQELARLAPRSFSISKEQYCKHQLENPYLLPNGRSLYKPENW